ncbi:MAG: acyltransferase [Aquabacterium sp.]
MMSAEFVSTANADRRESVASIGSFNSIGAIRLFAAWLVIVGHSFPLGGFGEDPLIALTANQIALGRVSVDVFFCLSGYLIAKSFENRGGLFAFAWARFLRIYPAYWVCIAVTAFIASPILNGSVAPDYFLKNLPLLVGGEGYIAGTATENGIPTPINGALWTLKWELLAYIFCGAVGLAGWLRKKRHILAMFLLVWAVFVYKIYAYPGLATSPTITSGWRLFTFFLAGMLFYAARDRIILDRFLFAGSLLVLVLALVAGTQWPLSSGGVFYAVAPLPLCYAVFYLTKKLPLQKINAKNDISYGVYIYGTLLLNVTAQTLPIGSWAVYLTLVTMLTVVLSWASWLLIEKPALRLKRLVH